MQGYNIVNFATGLESRQEVRDLIIGQYDAISPGASITRLEAAYEAAIDTAEELSYKMALAQNHVTREEGFICTGLGMLQGAVHGLGSFRIRGLAEFVDTSISFVVPKQDVQDSHVRSAAATEILRRNANPEMSRAMTDICHEAVRRMSEDYSGVQPEIDGIISVGFPDIETRATVRQKLAELGFEHYIDGNMNSYTSSRGNTLIFSEEISRLLTQLDPKDLHDDFFDDPSISISDDEDYALMVLYHELGHSFTLDTIWSQVKKLGYTVKELGADNAVLLRNLAPSYLREANFREALEEVCVNADLSFSLRSPDLIRSTIDDLLPLGIMPTVMAMLASPDSYEKDYQFLPKISSLTSGRDLSLMGYSVLAGLMPEAIGDQFARSMHNANQVISGFDDNFFRERI